MKSHIKTAKMKPPLQEFSFVKATAPFQALPTLSSIVRLYIPKVLVNSTSRIHCGKNRGIDAVNAMERFRNDSVI